MRVSAVLAGTLAFAGTTNSHLALISVRTGQVLRGVPDLALNAAIADGRGGWFAGSGVGLVRLRADGRLDPAWGRGRARELVVCLIARSGSRVYAEGGSRVDAFDARTGVHLWTSPTLAPRGSGICGLPVLALAASSTRVYVGGDFGRSVTALDAGTGRLLDWRIPRLTYGDAHAYVDALTVAGPRLYVGGVFATVGRARRSGLAALDTQTGAVLPWNAGNVGDVETILVTHGEVVTAGHDGFAATSASTGRRLTWTPRIRGVASAFAASGSLIYLGGDLRNSFSGVDGRPRHNLAAFDVATGRFTSWAPNLAPYVSVGTIAPSGDKVLVIGAFTTTIG